MPKDAPRQKRMMRALRSFPGSGVDALQQFQLSVLLLLVLLAVGVAGYMRLEGMSWLEGAYMTVITLTTVGFGEVHPLSEAGRVFTMVLIALGVSLAAFAARNLVEIAAGDRLWLSVGERQMGQRLKTLTGHYIICGYGRMGREIANEFRRRGATFVVVDQDEMLHSVLLESDTLHVVGDATHDNVLLDAGIERAEGLLSVVDSDADNVLIVLSAKGLNPEIKIVARAATDEIENKLRRAGADHVTSPYVIGGQRMAFAMTRPEVYGFLNTVVYSEQLHIEMGQLRIRERSPLAGLTLRNCDLRSRWNASVIAIVTSEGETLISPDPNRRLDVGDTLIVVAPTENIKRLEEDGSAG